MPTFADYVHVAKELRHELDRSSKAFVTVDRTDLTALVRAASGQPTTRIKRQAAEELERALSDQGLRCHPGLAETTTGDRVRVYRSGSDFSELSDAVLLPSTEHDRYLEETLEMRKLTSSSTRAPRAEPSFAEILNRILPREALIEHVRTIDDPDLMTT